MRARRFGVGFVAAMAAAFLAGAPGASATTVRDLARLSGQGEFILRGQGLVIGLDKSGDNGKDNAAMIRTLAGVLANEGNPIQSLGELIKTSSVALVMVTCVVPQGGARLDDRLDVTVSCIGNAKSLEGGELFIAPLQGPTPRHNEAWAFAAGAVELDNPARPTRGRVRAGARLVKEIKTAPVGESFDLVIERPFAGHASASQIASDINASLDPGQTQGPRFARAIDDRVVRVTVPPGERQDTSGFVAAVMSTDVNAQLLGLGAKVICNVAREAIIVTADVEISPVVITQKDLNIATVVPERPATPEDPRLENHRWVPLENTARPSQRARLADLLGAFKQLQIPVAEQINILQMLHKTGKLHAELIVD